MNKNIYFKEDIIRGYSDSRKDISYNEIEDLLNSTIAFIRNGAKEKETVEIELSIWGVLHKIVDYDLYQESDLTKKNKTNTKLMILEALGNKRVSAKNKRQSKEEIQNHVNNHLIEN